MGSEQRRPDAELLRAFRDRVRAQIVQAIEREDAEAEELRARVVPLVRHALLEAREAKLGKGAWLFGSYAWGKPTPRSDVDLLVEACLDPDRRRRALAPYGVNTIEGSLAWDFTLRRLARQSA